MRKLTADLVIPVAGDPIPHGVVVVDDSGKILAVETAGDHDPASLEKYRGVLIPGFVNTHCHLELSHMKGLVDTGTGLLPFLQSVVAFRDFPMEQILDAIDRADREMYENGIVAVGDISNKLDTAETKERSAIRYYTFVEMFDFLQDAMARQTYEQYYAVFEGQSANARNRKSVVPHAPYTVSSALFDLLNETNPENCTVSIHNQETEHENAFFLNKTGGFIDFYKSFGFSIDHHQPTGKTSIHYALGRMNPASRTLFVHNTMTTAGDIRAAQAWSANTYWATCANANLYIENRLPDYRAFLETGARMTIGTDSLTSNWQLSVLDELKTISKYQSYVPFETLIRWATLNGAEALGFDDTLGSLEAGKTPGILLLEVDPAEPRITASTRVKRII